MKSIRKVTAAALAVLMAASMLLMSSCSTPAVAMTVDGKDYTTGEYLANLYMNFYNTYYQGGLYQYASYGMDPWTQTFPYGEGDEAEDLELADYLIAMTKDGIVRQKAIKNLMEQYGITVPQEDLDEFYASMEDAKESEMIAYGFNKEHYMSMYVAMNLEEQKLFYQLYDKDGQKAVSEEEIRDYFDTKYVAFKSIAISQMDNEGKALSDDEKEKNRKELEPYLEMLNGGKTMDEVIAQYDTDHTTTTTGTGTTTTTAATTTTTAAETTTTTTTVSETEATTTTTTAVTSEEASKDEATEEEVEEQDPNLQMVNAATGDEKIVEAVQKVPEKTAQIIEYTDSSDNTYVALVYRLNTEEEGGKDYFENQRDTILYGLKFEEFDKEVQAVVDSLEVTYSDRAIKMCDPKKFEEAMQ